MDPLPTSKKRKITEQEKSSPPATDVSWSEKPNAKVRAFGNRTFIQTSKGLYAFGENSSGQLGLGHTIDQLTPVLLPFFSDKKILGIAGGSEHTIIQTDDGLYSFGNNNYGQLGLGHTTYQPTPVLISFFRDMQIFSIAAGEYYTIVHTSQGLYAFGNNSSGQLGLGHTTHQPTPVPISFFRNMQIDQIVAGFQHTIVRTTQGLYVFGDNDCCQLGLLERGMESKILAPEPLQKFRDQKILLIAAGGYHTVVRTNTSVIIFGDNTHGQIKYLNKAPQGVIALPLATFTTDIVDIAVGHFHTVIQTTKWMYSFGSNNFAQLGFGHNNEVFKLRAVPLPHLKDREHTVFSIGAGGNHTVLSTNGGILVFGRNHKGQLGLGHQNDQQEPRFIPVPWDG